MQLVNPSKTCNYFNVHIKNWIFFVPSGSYFLSLSGLIMQNGDVCVSYFVWMSYSPWLISGA